MKPVWQEMLGLMFNICFGLLVVSVGGCATIYTQAGEENDCGVCLDTPRLYSGTAYNMCYITNASPMMLINIIDLPLSFVADTVISPFTGYQQYTKGSFCGHAEAGNDK